MAIKSKSGLNADNNNIIKPGVPGGILANDENGLHEDMIDSSLNLAEASEQVIVGDVTCLGTFTAAELVTAPSSLKIGSSIFNQAGALIDQSSELDGSKGFLLRRDYDATGSQSLESEDLGPEQQIDLLDLTGTRMTLPAMFQLSGGAGPGVNAYQSQLGLFIYTELDDFNLTAHIDSFTGTVTNTITDFNSGPVQAVAITAITQANPAVVTAPGHAYITGDRVGINFVAGMTEINGIVTASVTVSGDDITLNGVDSTAFTAYAGGGEAGGLLVFIPLDNLNRVNPSQIYFSTFTNGTAFDVDGDGAGVWNEIIGYNIEKIQTVAFTEDIGTFFQDDIVLTGEEESNRFIYNGGTNGDKSLTLPLESTVDAGYIITVENLSTKFKINIDILAQGSDTIIGTVAIDVGDTLEISVSGVGEYTTRFPSAQVFTTSTMSGVGTQASPLSVIRNIHSREIFVSDGAGDDASDGMNIQTQVKSVTQAAILASGLIPAPSFLSLTTINDFGGSRYDESIVGVGFVQYNLPQSLIFSQVGGTTVIDAASGDDYEIGFISTSLASAGIGVLIDNVTFVRLSCDSIGVEGDNQKGIVLSGTCEELSISNTSIVSRGDNCECLEMTNTTFNNNSISFDSIDVVGASSTGVLFNVAGWPCNLIVDNVHVEQASSKAFDIQQGYLAVSSSLIVGDMNVDAGATFVLHCDSVSNNSTINVDGTMCCWIIEGNPTITGSGTINGYIGGVYYGAAKPPVDIPLLNQRQIIRSGVKTNFSLTLINGGTDIQVTADNAAGSFIVYFEGSSATDSLDGVQIEVDDQVVPVLNPAGIVLQYVHVDESTGDLVQTGSKVSLDDTTKVHLFVYVSDAGIIAPESVMVSPRLSWVDYSFQGALEAAGNVVNKLTVESTADATLGLATSNFTVTANSINYLTSKVSPHVLNVTGESPVSWTYLDSSFATLPPINADNLLDPTQWDNNGTLEAVGMNQATVQLMLLAGSYFIILHGQSLFANYDDAVLFMDAEVFDIPAILGNAIPVARIALKGSATDSDDIAEITIRNLTRI